MSAPSNPLNDDEIKKFVESKLEKSGYSFQNRVQEKLKKAFSIRREQPFLDKDSGKGRQIDLIATTSIPNPDNFKDNRKIIFASIDLIIECKSQQGNAWVFFPDTQPILTIPDYYSVLDSQRPDPFKSYMWAMPIKEMLWASGYSEFIFDPKKSNNKEDNLYDAINVVTKATKYEKDSFAELANRLYFKSNIAISRIAGIVIFQPVIIFNGKMYKTSSLKESQIESVSFVQMPKKYISQNYNENLGTIHIVSFDALDDYIDLIIKYYLNQAAKIIDNQEVLLRATAHIWQNRTS